MPEPKPKAAKVERGGDPKGCEWSKGADWELVVCHGRRYQRGEFSGRRPTSAPKRKPGKAREP